MKKAYFISSSIALIIGIGLGVLFMKYTNHINYGGKSMNSPNHPSYELEQKIQLGDTNSYKEISLAYFDGNPKDGLFCALFMANKFNYPRAYWDVYFFITQSGWYGYSDSALYKMDNKTRRFALEYLKLAAEKNEINAVSTLKEFKDKHYPIEWLAE